MCLNTALYLNCCTADAPNSQYHWDKSCGPVYQLHTHSLLQMYAQLEPKMLMDHCKLDTVCVHLYRIMDSTDRRLQTCPCVQLVTCCKHFPCEVKLLCMARLGKHRLSKDADNLRRPEINLFLTILFANTQCFPHRSAALFGSLCVLWLCSKWLIQWRKSRSLS